MYHNRPHCRSLLFLLGTLTILGMYIIDGLMHLFSIGRRHNPHTLAQCCYYLCIISLYIVVISSACIFASSVQSTGGGDDDKPYLVSTIAGNGAGVWKVNVPALEATFFGITGMAQSKNGDLYASIGEKHVVLKLEFNKEEGTWSNVTIIAGTGTEGRGDDGIVGTQSAFDYPVGLSLIEYGSSGEVTAILIADMKNNRIRQLDMSTRMITTIAGTGAKLWPRVLVSSAEFEKWRRVDS